jgi:hypothetical protein
MSRFMTMTLLKTPLRVSDLTKMGPQWGEICQTSALTKTRTNGPLIEEEVRTCFGEEAREMRGAPLAGQRCPPPMTSPLTGFPVVADVTRQQMDRHNSNGCTAVQVWRTRRSWTSVEHEIAVFPHTATRSPLKVNGRFVRSYRFHFRVEICAERNSGVRACGKPDCSPLPF